MRTYLLFFLSIVIVSCRETPGKGMHPAVVLQTDFGLKDGAVSAMKGVIRSVDASVDVYDLTHEIPVYNTWEAGYRLAQTAEYWPAGTVFVSVVDPGVGTARKSIVLHTRSGHFFVGPDNGSFGLVAERLGLESVREIDEAVNRRASSQGSYTFHGRDVYAYTAARLAAGIIRFEAVGNRLADTVVTIPFTRARKEGDSLRGTIPVLDIQYGNIWTNIPDSLLRGLGKAYGDSLNLLIRHQGQDAFRGRIPLVHTFGEVPEGAPLAYVNSLMQLSFALNMGSMAERYQVQSGPAWEVVIW